MYYDSDNNKKELKGLRKQLRKNLTPAEAKLWGFLKSGRLDNTHWRRQFSIGNYIMDFYCPQKKLCVELDGDMHFTMEGDEKDAIKTEFLASKGIRVVRFENKEVWDNIDAVLSEIRYELNLCGEECL